MFEAGDKVRVSKNLVGSEYYGGLYFNLKMEKYRGEVFQIKRVTSDDDYVLQDEKGEALGSWHFNDAMLERVEEVVRQPQEVEVFGDRTISMGIRPEKVIYADPATILFYRLETVDGLSAEKKIVAKLNVEAGDIYDKSKGLEVAILKALRKEIDKVLRKI